MINIPNPSSGIKLLLLLISLLFAFFLTVWTSNDFLRYTEIVNRSNGLDFLSYYEIGRYEVGSSFIFWFVGQFPSPNVGLLLIIFISLYIKQCIFSRHLHYATLAFIAYVLIFAHILDANQIRAALASCFILYALLIEPRKNYTYLLLALIGMIFHYSAIFILCLYLSRRPITALIILVISSYLYIDILSNFEFARIYILELKGHANLTSSFFLIQCIISITGFTIWNKLTITQKRGLLFSSIGVVVYLIFNDTPMIAHRVRELSMLGIFPLLFYEKQKLTYVNLIWIMCVIYFITYSLFKIFKEFLLVYFL